MELALVVMVLAIVVIATRRIACQWAALLGAVLLVLTGVLTPFEALSFIDWETLGLLAGMLVFISILVQAGFFSWMALRALRIVNYRPDPLFVAMILFAAGMALFTNAIVVILLFSALTLQVCLILKLNPIPLVLAEACAVCVINLPLPAVFGAGAMLAIFYLANRARLRKLQNAWSPELISAIEELGYGQTQRYLTRVGLTGSLAAVVLLAVSALVGRWTGIPFSPAFAVLLPAVIALACVPIGYRRTTVLKNEGASMLFFVGLFVLIGGLEKSGVFAALAVLWARAAFIGRIPGLVPDGARDYVNVLVVWSLALGVDLDTKLSSIGASLSAPSAWRVAFGEGLYRLWARAGRLRFSRSS